MEVEEAWKGTEDTKYIGMQATEGDLAIFLKAERTKLSSKTKPI